MRNYFFANSYNTGNTAHGDYCISMVSNGTSSLGHAEPTLSQIRLVLLASARPLCTEETRVLLTVNNF